MQGTLIILILLGFSSSLHSQVLPSVKAIESKKPLQGRNPSLVSKNKPPTTTAQPPPKAFTSLLDSGSYAIGLSVANFYSQQGITHLNSNQISSAINDVMSQEPIFISDQQGTTLIKRLIDYGKSSRYQNKALVDSGSYAIGLSVANFYSQQGIKRINTFWLTKAINDVFSSKALLLNDMQANAVMMRFIEKAAQVKAQPIMSLGAQFLAQNKNRPGVKTTPTGLQYEVLEEGNGHKPTINDTVTVHYIGTLIDGTEFDNSYKRVAPISFAVSGVIRGWTEVLQLMQKGAKYKVYIPSHLGYGMNDVGPIPGGSVLIFEIKLLAIAGN